MAFWVRRKFPAIALFFLLRGEDERKTDYACEFCLLINGLQVFQGRRDWPVDHVWLFDLRIHLTASKWQRFNEQIKSGWNRVQISCSVIDEPKNVTIKCCGIHLYKDRMNIHHVSFISPDLHGSNMAHDNDSLEDIYDEVREDVVFPTILAKYFNKNILEVMGNLQSSKRNDNGYDYDEEFELGNDTDTDTDNQHMEEEQHSASLNRQILENRELVNKDKGKGMVVHNNNLKGKQNRKGLLSIVLNQGCGRDIMVNRVSKITSRPQLQPHVSAIFHNIKDRARNTI